MNIKTITRESIRKNMLIEYDNICHNHSISSIDKVKFHQVINGLYQATGTMGAYFPKDKSLSVRFYFVIEQNYSSEALNVLLNLQKILNIGKVKLGYNSKDQAYLRYVVSNTRDILFKVLPYFSLLYGQKNKDRFILLRIYILGLEIAAFLKKEIKLKDTLLSEFVQLIYSVNPEGKKHNLCLYNKLQLLNCNPVNYNNNLFIIENDNLPKELFIIGLILGDGSFGFVFETLSFKSPKLFTKIVFNFATQSNTDNNILLLNLVAEKMNLKPQIYKTKSGMMRLEYTGETVSKIIMPFLKEHENWLFWRKKSFFNAKRILAIFKINGHLTKNGLKAIINLLYDMPNKYLKSKDFWLDLIEKRFLLYKSRNIPKD